MVTLLFDWHLADTATCCKFRLTQSPFYVVLYWHNACSVDRQVLRSRLLHYSQNLRRWKQLFELADMVLDWKVCYGKCTVVYNNNDYNIWKAPEIRMKYQRLIHIQIIIIITHLIMPLISTIINWWMTVADNSHVIGYTSHVIRHSNHLIERVTMEELLVLCLLLYLLLLLTFDSYHSTQQSNITNYKLI